MNDDRPELPNSDLPTGQTYPVGTSDTRASQPTEDFTRLNTSQQPLPHRQPVPVRPSQPGPHAQRMPHRGRARRRRDRGYTPPWWSLLLVILFVLMTVAGIVVVVVNLGGNEAPEKAPQIIVSSPIPTERPASFPLSPASPTIPPEVDPNVIGFTAQPLALAGPTLEAIVFTPTPQLITIGSRVVVLDVAPDQLNVRDNPGVTGTSIIFQAEELSEFVVVDGPRQADGLTWWRVEDPLNTSRAGWAASNYLVRQDATS